MYTTHITFWTHSNPHDGTHSIWCAKYTTGIRIYKDIMATCDQNRLYTLNTSPSKEQNKQSMDLPPQTPPIHSTYLSHPQILCCWQETPSTFIRVQGPTSPFILRLPGQIACCPIRYRVPPDRSRTLSCPSPTHSHTARTSLLPSSAFT